MDTELTLTAIYVEAEEGGYSGFVAELPGAISQGETLEDVRENLLDAARMILDVNREQAESFLTENSAEGKKIVRESLVLRAA